VEASGELIGTGPATKKLTAPANDLAVLVAVDARMNSL
jgi:hypothetical protein